MCLHCASAESRQYCVDMDDWCIASGSADTTIRVWSHAGACIHVLSDHVGIVRCIKACGAVHVRESHSRPQLDGWKLVSGGDNRQVVRRVLLTTVAGNACRLCGTITAAPCCTTCIAIR